MPVRLRNFKMTTISDTKNIVGHKAFTLVEILVATSVLSLFMLSVFGIYEYSRSGFETGSWRLQSQKSAQTFLMRLKDLLERSNHAYAVAPSGDTQRVADRPTVLNEAWFNQVATATNHGILYFSIISPYVPEQADLGQTERKGTWKGVGLDCKNKTLRLYMTGNWDDMPAHTPADVGSPDLARFEFGHTEGDFAISLNDVAEIGIFATQATQTTDIGRPAIFLSVELVLENQRSRQKARVTERMTASLVDRKLDEIRIAPAGSFPTP